MQSVAAGVSCAVTFLPREIFVLYGPRLSGRCYDATTESRERIPKITIKDSERGHVAQDRLALQASCYSNFMTHYFWE